MYDLRCLGEATLRDSTGELVHFRSRKHLALLIYMALNADRAHRRERLASMLWSDSNESKARHSLSQALYAVRRLLNGAVRIEGDDLELDTDGLRVDAVELEHLFGNGNASDAADIYKGDFLEGFWVRSAQGYEEWILHERARLSALARDALRKAIKSARNRANWSEVRTRAERLVRLDPFDEVAYVELMRALWMQGDRSAALERYDDLKSVLKTELDSTPSKDTHALVERIRERPVRGGWSNGLLLREPEPSIFIDPPFVGRKKEMTELSKEWEIVSTGESRTVALVGDAGIGKTRLAGEFLKTLELEDVTILRGRCYEAEQSLPYGPIAEALRIGLDELELDDVDPLWLAELARIVPEVHERYGELPEPTDLDAEGSRRRLFEGVAQVCRGACETRPIILFVDDFHWADESSAALLHYIQRRATHGLYLLVAYRAQEASLNAESSSDSLQHLMARETRSINVQSLDESEEIDLFDSLIDDPASRGASGSRAIEALQDMSGGNPFFAIELARALAESEAEHHAVPAPVPNTIRSVLTTRFDNLSVRAAALSHQAAILGTRFSYDALCAAAGISPLELDSLFLELKRAGIMSTAGDQVCFRHDLMRNVAHAQAPQAIHATLHRRAAEALIETNADPAEIARHFSQAGDDDQAHKWGVLGAERAEAVFALRSAAELLELALRHSRDTTIQRELTERISKLYQQIWDYQKAKHFLEKRLDLALRTSSPASQVFEARGNLLFLDVYSGSISTAEAVRSLRDFFLELKSSGIDALLLETEVLCSLFWAAARCFDTHLAEETISRIQDLHQRNASPLVSYRTARSLGIHEYYCGRPETAKRLLMQAVDTAKRLGDEKLIAEAYHGFSILLARLPSRELAEEVLDVARTAEKNVDPGRAGALLCNCAVCYNYLGEFDKAERLLNKATKILNMADYKSDLATSIDYNLGFIAEARGNLDAAEKHWQDALRLSRKHGVLPVTIESLAGLGRLHIRKSDAPSARILAAEATRLTRKGRHFVDERLGLMQLLAELRYASGRCEKALRELAKTALASVANDVPLHLASQSKRVEILLREGRRSEAESIAAQLRAVADQYGAAWWYQKSTHPAA
jgi:DNA-binding SARP family transcriptional activator